MRVVKIRIMGAKVYLEPCVSCKMTIYRIISFVRHHINGKWARSYTKFIWLYRNSWLWQVLLSGYTITISLNSFHTISPAETFGLQVNEHVSKQVKFHIANWIPKKEKKKIRGKEVELSNHTFVTSKTHREDCSQ